MTSSIIERKEKLLIYPKFLLKIKINFIQTFKLDLHVTVIFCIIRGFVNTDCDPLFSIIDCETSRTRGHNIKVSKKHSNINCRLDAFVCRK